MTILLHPFSVCGLWASSVENPVFADKILHLLKTEPDAFDDVWLEPFYSLPDLEKHRRMAELNARFAEKVRGSEWRITADSGIAGHRGCGIGSYEAWRLGADGGRRRRRLCETSVAPAPRNSSNMNAGWPPC
jgi:hypothetical protein